MKKKIVATGFSGFGGGLSFGAPAAAAPTTSSFAFNTPGFGQATNSAPAGFGGFGSSFGSSIYIILIKTKFTFFLTLYKFVLAFGKPATAGFGTSFGQPQQQLQPQQQPQALTPDEAFAQSIFNVSIFGDERDTVIAKWNYLQAMWGRGKSFYAQNAPPVDITPQNYLCRFKAIGYSKMPGKDNKIGLVALGFNKPESQIK